MNQPRKLDPTLTVRERLNDAMRKGDREAVKRLTRQAFLQLDLFGLPEGKTSNVIPFNDGMP